MSLYKPLANMVSACHCLIYDSWTFCVVAGMFVYISLADVMSAIVTSSCQCLIGFLCVAWIYNVTGMFLCISLADMVNA